MSRTIGGGNLPRRARPPVAALPALLARTLTSLTKIIGQVEGVARGLLHLARARDRDTVDRLRLIVADARGRLESIEWAAQAWLDDDDRAEDG